MNNIMRSLTFTIVFGLATPALGMNEIKKDENSDDIRSNIWHSLYGDSEHDDKEEDLDSVHSYHSEYYHDESDDSVFEDEDESPVPEKKAVNTVFWHNFRKTICQTLKSLCLGFVTGATLGNPDFTKKYGKIYGLIATYTTASLSGGIKSPIGCDDEHHWKCVITKKQAWLTGAGFLGYLAGRMNSQKIANSLGYLAGHMSKLKNSKIVF